MSGTFIVLEGPDGAGTTTHAKFLAERLQQEGKEVVLTAEPSEGPIGGWIRERLNDATPLSPAALQMLFCADRAEHLRSVIEPALAAGKIVVCDRYIPSTIVYGESVGLDIHWLKNLNTNFRQPDAVILLLPPREICRERLRKRAAHDLFEQEELQDKVYAAYQRLAKADKTIRMIDTSKEKQETAREIYEAATKK